MPRDPRLHAARRRPLFEIDASARARALAGPTLDELLPHRPPFLLLDHLEAVDLAARAGVGVRWIDPADPILAGHFPGAPIYPGVLLIEMIGQLGICVDALLQRQEAAEAPPAALRLTAVVGALFLAPVHPGETLTVLARVDASSDYLSTCVGQVLVGAEVRAAAVLEVLHVDPPTTTPDPEEAP